MEEKLPKIPSWLRFRPLFLIGGIIAGLAVYARQIEITSSSKMQVIEHSGNRMKVKTDGPVFTISSKAQHTVEANGTAVPVKKVTDLGQGLYSLELEQDTKQFSGGAVKLLSMRKIYKDYTK